MKRSTLILMSVILVASISFSQKKADKTPSGLKTSKDKMSYVVGYDLGSKIGADIKKQGLDFNLDAFARGMREAIGGTKLEGGQIHGDGGIRPGGAGLPPAGRSAGAAWPAAQAGACSAIGALVQGGPRR